MRFFSFLTILLLVSQSALAERIVNVRVFVNDAISVENDLPPGTYIPVVVYNMDSMERSEKKLTALVKSKVPTGVKQKDIAIAYQEAFSEILNGPQWPEIYSEIERSSAPVEYAMRLKIKKLPAIVINDKSIIYGVYSVKEAVQIFRNTGGEM
jgi:integrating conjugative element protein (TIGR03757 family)